MSDEQAAVIDQGVTSQVDTDTLFKLIIVLTPYYIFHCPVVLFSNKFLLAL